MGLNVAFEWLKNLFLVSLITISHRSPHRSRLCTMKVELQFGLDVKTERPEIFLDNFRSLSIVKQKQFNQRNNNFNVPWQKLFASFVLIKTPLIYERDYKTIAINSLVVP